jgi:hypothetical protein
MILNIVFLFFFFASPKKKQTCLPAGRKGARQRITSRSCLPQAGSGLFPDWALVLL